MAHLVGEFYERITEAKSKELPRGQICWAPVNYLPRRLQLIALQHYDPRDENQNLYGMATEPADMFKHAPVYDLGLETKEELVVTKAKIRPVVIASGAPGDWAPGGQRLAERGFTCLPIYSFHDGDPAELRARIEALEYPKWIHLPADTRHRVLEGFVRLDRVQVIEERQLQPWPTALTADALWYVSEWLRFHLTGDIDPLLLEYRTELLKQLKGDPEALGT